MYIITLLFISLHFDQISDLLLWWFEVFFMVFRPKGYQGLFLCPFEMESSGRRERSRKGEGKHVWWKAKM